MEQIKINISLFEYIKNNRDICYANIDTAENLLRNRGYLSEQLINQCRVAAQKYRAERENSANAVMRARKKKEAVKQILDKEIENKKEKDKNSGGGPDKDPDDDPLPVKNRSIMMHIFQKKAGHLLDTLENRELLRSLVCEGKNYLGKDNAFQRHWYARITKDGKQFWAWMRNGKIRDGGLNNVPVPWNPEIE